MKIIFLLTWAIFTNQLFAMYNKPPRQQPCPPISNTVFPNVPHCRNKPPIFPKAPHDPPLLHKAPHDPHVSTPSPRNKP